MADNYDDVMRILVEESGEANGERKSAYSGLPFITLDHWSEAQAVAVLVVDEDSKQSVAMLVGRNKSLVTCEWMTRLLEDLLATVKQTRDEIAREVGN